MTVYTTKEAIYLKKLLKQLSEKNKEEKESVQPFFENLWNILWKIYQKTQEFNELSRFRKNLVYLIQKPFQP